MLREQIIEKMTELKMAGMLAAYDELSATAQKTRMTGEKLVRNMRSARPVAYAIALEKHAFLS